MSQDTTKKTVGSSEVVARKTKPFTKQEAITQALAMLESARFLLVGTNAEDGFPNIKALNYWKHEGLKTIWLQTGASSHKVQQMKKDNRVCIYCLDGQAGRGLMLIGTVEILNAPESKDPEYIDLRFTAIRANMVPADGPGLTFDIE